MRTFLLCLLVCSCAALAVAARTGSRVEYLGGTRGDIPANNSGEIRVTNETYFIFISKHTEVKIPYERINLLEYGQKIDRHYIAAAIISPLFMVAKKREHFLTVGFENDNGHQEAMVFRVNKDDLRLTLVTLEARTGQEVKFQDEEARIYGKG
jgi:hypothetical protein